MADLKEQTIVLKKMMEGKGDCSVDSKVEFHSYSFHSVLPVQLKSSGTYDGNLFYHELVDRKVPENIDFNYFVLAPRGTQKYAKGILLLHGLNERSWDKYLTWAEELVKRMNCPVILFPISYHMNRSPKNWSDPRQMKAVVNARQQELQETESTFANAALSTRLSAHPEQFVYSGVQSFFDICHLAKQIRNGDHPMFDGHGVLDVFAYSIGAFLSEIVMIANPDNLFSNSKLFIFAGGPTFDRMQGTSRYIMDLSAFNSLLNIKRKRTLKRIYRHLAELQLPDFEKMWKGFYGMLHHRKARKIRREWLAERGELLRIVALKQDKVMPLSSILKTYGANKRKTNVRIDVIDFPYTYTHENPFPLNDEKILPLVSRSFDVVFEKAAQFYQQTTNKVVFVKASKIKIDRELVIA